MPNHPSDKISSVLDRLEKTEKLLLNAVPNILTADDHKLYAFDFLANAALKRSVALSSGFRTLICDQNFTCAGALIRLQLDTALRFMAGFIVENPHEFATAVMEGNRINKMKDRDGECMTDRYLVNKMSEKYSWVGSVYEQTSNYIHFSDTHIFSMSDGKNDSDETYSISIGIKDSNISDEEYLGAILIFHNITGILMSYIEGWIATKGNPLRNSEV
ncbi:MAG: hypothetical protein F4120_04665 [Rhodothermaceae bacterium]|nr:hypothetical protein [Rhodothermaceae bacterium]MXW31754.1 hypothetical protein [Rhodothermaceae bacterium]MYC03199.1 hypothetical protein [Rhodothermaceae bacterium]MYE62932.1 hypothetical protein [Rhodothermaceae bacterium]MYI16895.1 hypothetical protein [Rhodothermaceae bacterium]